MEKIGGGEPERTRGARRAWPGHRPRRRRPDPFGRPLDSRSRRRRSHGYRPAHRRDREIFPHIEPIEGRISGEQILCGRGLVNAYRAVAIADGKVPRFTTPAEVTAAALEQYRPGRGRGAGLLRYLPWPHGRRSGAGVQEPGRRFPHRRHRAEDRAGVAREQLPRGVRRQGAAYGDDARRCRSMSSPIRWALWRGSPPMPARRDGSASKRAVGAGRRRLTRAGVHRASPPKRHSIAPPPVRHRQGRAMSV